MKHSNHVRFMQKVLDFHKRPFSSFSFTARELPRSKIQHNHHGYALDAIQDEEENPCCEARHHVKSARQSLVNLDKMGTQFMHINMLTQYTIGGSQKVTEFHQGLYPTKLCGCRSNGSLISLHG